MIKKIVFDNLSALLNDYLRHDPCSESRLHALRKKIILIELLPFHLNITFQVIGDAIFLKPHAPEKYDVKITGTPIALLGVTLNKENRQAFFADDVTLEGDVLVANQVMRLFDQVAIDWEEVCSKYVGDISAHHIGRAVSTFKKFASAVNQSFTLNVGEYLHHEMMWLPTKTVMQDFLNEVDETRMHADRLTERLKQLESDCLSHEASE